MNVACFFREFFAKKIHYNRYNVFALGFLAILGHPMFWIAYTYLVPQEFESFCLRGIGFVSCIILLLLNRYIKNFGRLEIFYWILCLVYNLPFFFTIALINNHFNNVWVAAEIIMFVVMIMAIDSWMLAIFLLLLGIYLASIYCSIFYPQNPVYNHIVYDTFPISLFGITTATIFGYSNIKGMSVSKDIKYKNTTNLLKSLAASIAHELRNPLNAVSLLGAQINNLLSESFRKSKKVSDTGTSYEISDDAARQMTDLISGISDTIHSANNIINIILGDLSEKKIDEKDFSYLEPEKILTYAISKYGYKSQDEKKKVKLELSWNNLKNKNYQSFVFKAVQERFVFIIYNLIKNALYYPDSIVTIGIEERVFQGKIYNTIYVRDTGPGISPENIKKLFADFFTTGKKDGTGLGLAFCKRNMKAFGGDIICESELGKWTKFSLLFPVLSEEEIKAAETESKKKKILIIDDQKANLLVAKSRIEKNLSYISCDIAVGGADGMRMAKDNKYSLILMDIQMPEVSGIDITKKIRATNKETPIIAITSLDYETFMSEVVLYQAEGEFNYYISKSVPENILYRTVAKWMVDVEDCLPYLGSKQKYTHLLQNKEAILADDQELNRMVTRNKLKSSGMKITEAKDGKELVEIYKNSLDTNGKSKFDIILTDINMPPFNGDDASKEIRAIELQNKILHHNRIPIIALSGDGDVEAVHHFFRCEMTDYFVKGRDPESLIKIIANCFVERDEGIEDAIVADITTSETVTISGDAEAENVNPENLIILDPEKISSFSESDRKEILLIFLKDSNQIVIDLKQKKVDGDVKALSFLMHSIKGISSNIGAEKLYEYIKDIELDLKAGKFPKDEDWLEKFNDYYAELKKEIEKVLGSKE